MQSLHLSVGRPDWANMKLTTWQLLFLFTNKFFASNHHSEAQASVEEISNGDVKLNFDHCNQSGRPLYLTFLLLKPSF